MVIELSGVADPAAVTNVWELDVYSRPVTVGGKKLWELLITDSSGSFKHVEPIPSNKVRIVLGKPLGVGSLLAAPNIGLAYVWSLFW